MNSRRIRFIAPCLDCLRRCLARKNYRPASGSAGSDRFSVTGRGKSTVSIPTLMVLKPIFWRPWPKREQAPAQGIKRSLARFRPEADYQICLRRLELLEPVYRMQFGPAINNGWRTSLCSKCLDAFVRSFKRPSLRDGFRSSEPCEVCGRPVFNLKRWTVTRVICSPKCRGKLDAQPAKRFWTSRR